MPTTTSASRNTQVPEASAKNLRLFDVLPLPSPSTSILSSNLFLPGLLTAVASILLFFVADNPTTYFRVVAYYIVLVIIIIFYQNSTLRHRWLSLAFAAAAVTAILWIQPVLGAFIHVFRTLPGLTPDGTNWGFREHFVGAGLMEELIKAVPTLFGLAVVLVAALWSQGRQGGWLVENFGVITPMQGVMMGIAAGAAFTLIETLEQYVPNQQAAIADQVMEAFKGVKIDDKTRLALTGLAEEVSASTGVSSGFYLLMPRILGSLIMHMSYAAIFGYFIGLAGSHRGVWTLPLLVLGWVLAATVHGAWNASATIAEGGSGPFWLFMVGIGSFVVFITYFLKARDVLPGGAAQSA